MSQKIFDIVPPHLSSSTEDENIKDRKGIKNNSGSSGKKRRPKLVGVLVFLGVFLVLVAVYFYFSLASVSIDIWPVTEAVSFEQKIILDESLTEVDWSTLPADEDKNLPAQFIEEEKESWQEFVATGSSSKEGVAQGTIRVYNKYSPAAPITLVAKTRFLSDSGKLFRSVSKINLPAAQIKSGKVTPSWVDVEVIAVGSGEDYNIGPATFSLPGLSGTAYYYSIYGESAESMSGGYESALKVVTADDIDAAKDDLTQNLFTDIESALQNKASSSGLVLFSNAIDKSVIESSCSVKTGAEVEKFNCSAKVNAKALVAKEADLERLARDYILSQVPDSKTILEKTLVLTYNPELVDLKAGTISLNLAISCNIYSSINIQTLSLDFMGRNSSQISDVIYSKLGQEISRIKIDFWPFWVKKAPNDQSKIKVQLNFD